MSWIAVLLIGVAVTDLAHSIKPIPLVNECTGAAVAVWAGLVAGLTEPADLVALAVIAGVVVLWGHTVAGAVGRGRAWLPLLVLGGSARHGCSDHGVGRPRGRAAGGVAGVGATSRRCEGVSADRALLLVGRLPGAAEHWQRHRPAGAGRDRHDRPHLRLRAGSRAAAQGRTPAGADGAGVHRRAWGWPATSSPRAS